METPTTPAEVVIAITSISPKRAVMVDDLTAAIFGDGTEAYSAALEHPSSASRNRAGQKRRTRSADRGGRSSPPMTCATCRVTYLTPTVDASAVSPEGWVCAKCLQGPPAVEL